MSQMLSDQEWRRNVGTEAYPVSFLHEYSVALIYDQLILGSDVQLPLLNGERSGNVMEGVGHVGFPDSLQAIGGYLPDIALYDSFFRVIRVIEVVVTAPVPHEKLHSLESRGVEVLQVPVQNEDDVRALCPSTDADKAWWWPKFNSEETVFKEARRASGVNWQGTRQYRLLSGQEQADQAINELIGNLSRCSPEVRREFVLRLKDIDSLESLYPIRNENPKREVLGL